MRHFTSFSLPFLLIHSQVNYRKSLPFTCVTLCADSWACGCGAAKKAPGVYALSIQGKMPLHVEDALKEARVAPVPQL